MSGTEQKDAAAKNDVDLNDLLDDALKDFATSDQTAQSSNADKKPADTDDQNDFLVEKARLFTERMGKLVNTEEAEEQLTEKLMAGFKKMAEATAVALQTDIKGNDEEVKKYSDWVSEAIKGMDEAADNLQGGISEADFDKLFSELGMGEGEEAEENSFIPFMEGMMQSLLSPDIILPSIKDLLEKYPKYLEENADKLAPADKERYEKQLEQYKVICNHLESQKPDATAREKRENYKRIIEDMHKLHEYGQPPEEITSEMADLSGIETASAPPFPPENPQCPMM